MEKRSTRRRSRRPPGSDADAQQQLRASLEQVRRIIGVDAGPVARVLPEAIAQATQERATALEAALEPTVARSIRVVASRDSQWFGEILAPTIGAAVRKAVSAAFAALMQRLNEALERSLSLRSVRWRLEAHRTGVPFAEVVLLRTLLYRVEQAFLIHAESGLVLQHVVAEGVPSAEPDQVASMMAAIDAFGREAFAPTSPGAYLHEFAFGDLTVWVDRAMPIAVAVVIRGRPPRALLDVVAEARERILLDYREALTGFQADTTPFNGTAHILEQCLREQRKQAPQRGLAILIALAVVIVVVCAGLVTRSHHAHLAEERQLAVYRQALSAQPGIVVTSASHTHGRYRLGGLRDPVAAEPANVVAGLGPTKPDLVFRPYYSLEPAVIEARFRRVTTPPKTVTVALSGETLHLAGDAPREWIDRALRVASTLPGVEHVTSTLSDSTARELDSAKRELGAVRVPFAIGSSGIELDVLGEITRVLELIGQIESLSAGVRQQSCISVVGGADTRGPTALNRRLARERAQAVAAVIRQFTALRASRLEVRARVRADEFPPARSVHFRVKTYAPGTEGCGEGATW